MPDGAEKIISLPIFLQRIKHLLLYLLQLVLHLHYDVLHLGMVALGACGIYLTTHLLGYETKFLAHSMVFLRQCLAEIFQVVCQSLLFLADVEFLYVVYQLLLKSVLVIFHLWNACQTIYDALANLLNTTFLKRLYGSQKGFYVVYFLLKFLL